MHFGLFEDTPILRAECDSSKTVVDIVSYERHAMVVFQTQNDAVL